MEFGICLRKVKCVVVFIDKELYGEIYINFKDN